MSSRRRHGKKVRELIHTNGEVQAMYLLFKCKNWDPEVYIEAGPAKRAVLRAFIHEYVERINKANKAE